MDPLGIAAMIVGGSAAVAAVSRRRRPSGGRRWRAAERADLERFGITTPSWLRRTVAPPYWRTTVDGRLLVVREHTWREGSHQQRYVLLSQVMLAAPDLVPEGLRLTAFVGDAVLGDEALAAALLGGPRLGPASLRASLRQVGVHDGCLTAEVQTYVPVSFTEALVGMLLGVASRLGAARLEDGRIDVTRLLLENLRDGDVPSRVAALGHLLRRGEDPMSVRGLARTDADPAVRMTLAVHDRDVHALAELVDDPRVVSSQRARALGHLADLLEPDLEVELLMNALASGTPELADEATRRLGKLHHEPAAELIAMRVARASPERAIAGIAALERILAARSAPAIRAALRRPEPDVLIAAIDALGRVAEVDVVEDLRRLLHASLRDDVHLAVVTSIDLIQSRAKGADFGALSLTRDEEGALSMAAAPEGALSDPPEPEGETDR